MKENLWCLKMLFRTKLEYLIYLNLFSLVSWIHILFSSFWLHWGLTLGPKLNKHWALSPILLLFFTWARVSLSCSWWFWMWDHSEKLGYSLYDQAQLWLGWQGGLNRAGKSMIYFYFLVLSFCFISVVLGFKLMCSAITYTCNIHVLFLKLYFHFLNLFLSYCLIQDFHSVAQPGLQLTM